MSSLQLTVAKLELKQLEVVDKLSTKTDTEYVVRCIIDPLTTKIIDVNGDWEIVTGYNEGSCVGENWLNFIEKDRDEVEHFIEMALLSVNKFVEYKTKLLTVDGMVDVRWKVRYFPDIDAMISIGRVCRLSVIERSVILFDDKSFTSDKNNKLTLIDFFEKNNIPMHQVDSDGIIVNANQADLDNLGYSREEYIGSMARSHFVDGDCFDYVLEELNANRPLWKYKTKLIKKNKEVIDVSFMSSTDGKLSRCVIIPE